MAEIMMTGYAVALLVCMGVSLLASAHLHGRQEPLKHNFWTSLIATLALLALTYFGGFYG